MAETEYDLKIKVDVKIIKAKKAYDELKEKLEAASAAAHLLSGALANVGGGGKAFTEVKNAIVSVAATVTQLSTLMTALENSQAKAAASAAKLTIAQKAVNLAMKAFPIIAIVSAISTLADGIGKAISSLFGKKEAAEKATQALNEYQRVASSVGRTLSLLNEQEQNKLDELNNKYDEEVRKAKARGATQEELTKLELERQSLLTTEQFKHSKAREQNLDNQISSLKEAIGEQQKVLEEYSESKVELVKKMAETDMFGTSSDANKALEKYRSETEAAQQLKDELQSLINLKEKEQNLRDKQTGDQKDGIQQLKEEGAANKAEEAEKWRKTNADNAVAQLRVEEKLALDKLEVERDFSGEDFAARQEHEAKVFNLQRQYAQERLEALRSNKQISLKEYQNECALLESEQKVFAKKQAEAAAQEAESRKKQLGDAQKEIGKLIKEQAQLQLEETSQQYDKLIKTLESENKRLAEANTKLDSSTDEYKNNQQLMAQHTLTMLTLEEKKEEQLAEIRKTFRQKDLDESLAKVGEKYEAELAKYADNRLKKLELERQRLEEEKKLKLEHDGQADTGADDAALKANSLSTLEANAAKELALAGLTAKQKYTIEREALQKKLELLDIESLEYAQTQQQMVELDRAYQQQRIEQLAGYAQQAQEVIGALFEFSNMQDEAKLQKATEQNEQEKQQLQAQLDANLISKDEYNQKVKQSDDALAKEQAKIKRKQAIQDKAKAMFDVAISTATSIASSAKMGFPVAIPFIVMAAAMGALQLAAVAAQPLPKAAKGMYIKGASHSGGGVRIEAEGGEMIINKRSSSMFAPLLSAINQAGGGVPFVSNGTDGGFAMREYRRNDTQSLTSDAIAHAVREAVQEVKIYTAIEDINEGSKRYAAITDSSKF